MAVNSRVQSTITANANGLILGTRRASQAMDRMGKSVSGLRGQIRLLNALTGIEVFSGIARAASSALGTISRFSSQAVSVLQSAVDKSVDLGEETSKSLVLFGDAADGIQKFAAAASKIGLSEVDALRATGTFGNLFKAMGLGAEQAADYSTTLATLGADLASFNNTSVDDAITAIGAALRGESEPIRRYGVLLNDMTLRQEAVNMKLKKSVKESLDPASRALAAYGVILRQTAAAQGDFARTSDSLANMSRIAEAKFDNLGARLGSAFAPVFTQLKRETVEIYDRLEPFISDFAKGLEEGVSFMSEAIDLLGNQVQSFIGGLDGATIGEKLGGLIRSGADYLVEAFAVAVDNFQGVVDFFSESIAALKALWDVISPLLRPLFGAFQIFFGAVQNLSSAFAYIVAGIGSLVDAIPGINITKQVRELEQWSIKQTERANSSIDDGLNNLISPLVNAGEEVGKRAGDGLRNAWNEFKNQSPLQVEVKTDDSTPSRNALFSKFLQENTTAQKEVTEAINRSVAISRSPDAIDINSREGVKRLADALNGRESNSLQKSMDRSLKSIDKKTSLDKKETLIEARI